MKFKEQFTKGEWYAVGAWVEHDSDDVADIASFDPATINQGHHGRTEEEMCANAELCAAAPEMFRLLKKVAAACKNDTARIFQFESEIRKVISQARGDDRQSVKMS